MKRFLLVSFLILVLAIPSSANMVIGSGGAPCADASCTGFIACQNWEDSTLGHDNSENWISDVTGGGTVFELDKTAPILRGTQQLKIATTTADQNPFIGLFIASNVELWGHFQFKATDATPAAACILFAGTDASETVNPLIFWLNTNGTLRADHGSTTANGTTALSDNTRCHIWFHWTKGATTGILDVYLSANSTKPGTKEITISTGTSNVNIVYIRAIMYGAVDSYFYDQILIDDADIGSVCD